MKHCIIQKFNINVIKTAHRRSNFSETLVSQEIFANIYVEKICYKIARIFDLENDISMYLYHKNILEYAQIAQNETESKITYIESHPISYHRNLIKIDQWKFY